VAFTSTRRALACAIAIQRQQAERNRSEPGREVHVRIGLNTGEVTDESGDLYGQAVNAAARIAARAKSGEILCAEVVKQLAGQSPDLTFRDRGRCRLKGFPERWRLFGVVWTSDEGDQPAVAMAGRATPFVGRAPERAELQRLLDEAGRGSGALVLIGGEPGVGKTRLAEQLVAEASGPGREMQAFVGHAYEMEGAPPYVPFVEIFEQALARAPSPEAFRQALGQDAPEVAKLIPGLRRLCPDIPPPLELPAEQERRMLFNGVRDVLLRAAAHRPVLLVLDDLQWADEPTLLLVQHLAESLAEAPVLMVGTYRDSEADVGRPLARAFEDLLRRRHGRRITLGRMPVTEAAQMLEAMSGQSPPAPLAAVIYGETEGNPFFIEEVFKFLVEEGRLFDEAGRFRATLTIGELDVPEGVRLVIGRRLDRLGPDGRRVLSTAAVLGRAFDFELLEAAGDDSEDVLLDVVEEAERTGLVVIAAGGAEGDRFLFSHELIRQTLLAELSAPRRRRLHVRAADAIESVHTGQLDRHAAALAHHLAEAGPLADRARRFRMLVLAGRWALASAAFEEALRHYEEAAGLEEAAPPEERAELLFELGVARRSTGSWDGAIETWRRSVDAYEALNNAEAMGRVCLAACYNLSWVGRFTEAVELSQRALTVLGDRVSTDRACLLGATGMPLGAAGHYQAGAGMIAEEIALAAALENDAVLAHGLLNKCILHWIYMEHQESGEAGLAAAELLQKAGDPFSAASILAFIIMSLVHLGRPDEVPRISVDLEPLAERVGHFPALLQVTRVRAWMDFMASADTGRLEVFARKDMDECRRLGASWVNNGWAWLGIASFLRGDWDEARTRFEEGERIEPPGAMKGWNTGALFECLAYRGEATEALALLDSGAAELPRAGEPNGWGQWTLLLNVVEGLTVLGLTDRAAELYPLTLEAMERTGCVCGSFYDMRLIERAAGIAATAARRWDDAERHFVAAAEQAAALPHVVEAAHTRRFHGRMLLERDGHGDRDRALVLLAEAAEGYRRMSMPRHVELAESAVG
jgi:tetratricopeptide (TPR) repeat protein